MQYKPLSELAKDEEACRRIVKFAFDMNLFNGSYPTRHYVGIDTPTASIKIYHNGFISIKPDVTSLSTFALVDFIRELGYSPN